MGMDRAARKERRRPPMRPYLLPIPKVARRNTTMDLNQEPPSSPTFPHPPQPPPLEKIPEKPPDLFTFPPNDFPEDKYPVPPPGECPEYFLKRNTTTVEKAA